MSDVVEFLKARLDEDESVAGAADALGQIADLITASSRVEFAEHIAQHDPARSLREVAAMRRIVETHGGGPNGWHDDDGEPEWSCMYDSRNWPCPDLRALASIWSSHPDYREEWSR